MSLVRRSDMAAVARGVAAELNRFGPALRELRLRMGFPAPAPSVPFELRLDAGFPRLERLAVENEPGEGADSALADGGGLVLTLGAAPALRFLNATGLGAGGWLRFKQRLPALERLVLGHSAPRLSGGGNLPALRDVTLLARKKGRYSSAYGEELAGAATALDGLPALRRVVVRGGTAAGFPVAPALRRQLAVLEDQGVNVEYWPEVLDDGGEEGPEWDEEVINLAAEEEGEQDDQ